jgi:4-amino-4-deoxy-L-arabinose transferase-like glycosyltransferase
LYLSVNQPTPAIVAQGAVNRLPRIALLLFTIAYVLPGFLGRVPWKSADMTAFGYMAELASGAGSWFSPKLMGMPPEVDALLPYWFGAWAMQLAPSWMAPDFAARIPFGLMLALSMAATWYGTYYLARSPQAQPVAFAFGGEAKPADYARAMADGGLLAFIACLGLAQLAHETTPALAQLCFTTLFFYALAVLPYRTVAATVAGAAGLIGLALSGAPAMASVLGFGGALIHLLDRTVGREHRPGKRTEAVALSLITGFTIALVTYLGLWRWRIHLPQATWDEWHSLGRLFLWFTWPAWPLALWTLWRWRRQRTRKGVPSRHLALPLLFVLTAIGATLTTSAADRSLLLALPAMAALAAFALPTLRRSVAALIDWFTLLFFSGCALIIWIVWISMQTGFPRQPAANVMRLAPGFESSFSVATFMVAVAATLAWLWLVKWRVGRHRAAIWKSLVLPAGGAALSWLLLMTLWLPLLDYARSYAPLVRRTLIVMKHQPTCVQVHGLSRSQVAAFRFHGQLRVEPASQIPQCPWLIVDKDAMPTLSGVVNRDDWTYHSSLRHPADRDEDLTVFRRKTKNNL